MPIDKPIQYNIYKGVNGKYGAIQFSLQPAHFVCVKCKTRTYDGKGLSACNCNAETLPKEGCIFSHASSATGPNKYDWDNKIVFALSVNDLGKIINAMKTNSAPLSLYHDPNQQSANQGEIKKTMALAFSDKGIVITVSSDTNGNKLTHTIPVSKEEASILFVLFQTSIPRILGWQ